MLAGTSIEVVNKHVRVLHHALGHHHKPRLPVHHVLSPVVAAMLVSTVKARARVTELAHDLWVQEKALVAIAALRKELALLLGMHVLALSGRLSAVGPVLAPNLHLVRLRLRHPTILGRGLKRFHRLNRAKALKTLPAQLFSLLRRHLRLDKLLRLTWIYATLMATIILAVHRIKLRMWTSSISRVSMLIETHLVL